MTAFQIEAAIFERFPELKLGVLLLNNINNTSPSEELEHLLIAAQEKVRQDLSGITLSQHPQVAPWREAYRAFGVKAKDYPSSIENLLKRVLKGETLRSINPLVDLYNVVSLEHLIPIGGEDLDSLQGDIVLRFAGNDELAIHLLGDTEAKAPKTGEVIYADDLGAICRRFNWKEAERSKLTANTKRAVLVVEALPPVDEAKLQVALNQLSTLADRFCQASVTTHILSPASPMVTYSQT
jgi:DNA/RNA-binding domain of Phe-tRNA-synthetase-like protein